ncbi:helix-turn-helix domain-containing protein [Mesorhizobium carmichaelinearum]|uniref:helix-turn-helix domain-containing protein n=1 Tax=Mesorhizobium carmichaelinearum TaxID=1208188 RepID=UPI000BA30F3C|nr:helix-turn-helix domain-containing protein [Mesorhizobium carmichaelinearum]
MRYTPSQVRHVVGITQETLRHWRQALPSLRGLKGHAPVFRPGQLLGLTVVRVLVEDLGLTVGALRAAERDIFDICNSPQWIRLARGHLLVRPIEGRATFVDTVSDNDLERPAIPLPLEPIVTALRLALLEVAPEEAQQSLAFPPVDVSERRAAGSGRP